ncbi:MAG: acetyl-CoA carboxylase biotin carboxyl carrier protein subunit [Hyphomicrobiales bacterium]|nr:acetyl-CoA carboxylase biotin carboxyl carrier protein subunit [Hyphomicrobiales bacterium]MCP5370602.1 acetyl-CoA carboxylase biotin carboxyl carrier protein subunit [Hyphomicrobiales bacterium]
MARVDALASVTGTVWKIEKNVGDSVAEGDEIMILESMKMEIVVEAPAAGTIAEITVAEQDPVDEDQVVAVIESGS